MDWVLVPLPFSSFLTTPVKIKHLNQTTFLIVFLWSFDQGLAKNQIPKKTIFNLQLHAIIRK